MDLIKPDTRQQLLRHHPEAAQEIQNLEQVLDRSSLDLSLLELCREFIEVSLSGNNWVRRHSLTECEADCVAMCEQFMVSVSATNEQQVARLSRHFSEDELYNFMYAIYLIEMSQRLDLTLAGVLQ